MEIKNKMTDQYYEDEVFQNLSQANGSFVNKEFEQCVFENCNFSDGNFSHTSFTDCQFVNCNLSLIKLTGASFKTVSFQDCKLTGVDFSNCNDFVFDVCFYNSILDYATFFKLNMKKTKFDGCHLQDVIFTQTNLDSSIFENCDLVGAIFERTNLFNCNFTTSYNYIINPDNSNIRKAKFSLSGLPGLLVQYGIVVE